MDLSAANAIQTNYIDFDPERYKKLQKIDAAVDRINKMNGTETIVLGSQQYTAKNGIGKAGHFADAIKHDLRSPNYTTRWSDIIIVK